MTDPFEDRHGIEQDHAAGDSVGYRFLFHGRQPGREKRRRPASPAVELHLSAAARRQAEAAAEAPAAEPPEPPRAAPADGPRLHLEA